MGSALPAAVTPLAVSWGRAPNACQFLTADADLAAKAAAIFARWPDGSSAKPRWWRATCERTGLGVEAWDLESSDRAARLRCDTRDHLLAHVEAAAQQAFFDAEAAGGATMPFHAALLSRADRTGVMLVGARKAGKSTLACALWQRGWSLLADDALVVDPAARIARPSPRRAHLRAESEPFFPTSLIDRIRTTPAYGASTDGHAFHPREVDGRDGPDTIEVSAVVFVGRAAAAAPTLVAIAPAHGMLALLPYSPGLPTHGLGSGIVRLRPFGAAVALYDLPRGPIEAMADAVEALL